jgi:hypothetical protein
VQVIDLALIIVATQVAGISSASKERVTYWGDGVAGIRRFQRGGVTSAAGGRDVQLGPDRGMYLTRLDEEQVRIEPVAAPRIILDDVIVGQLDIESFEELPLDGIAKTGYPLPQALLIDPNSTGKILRLDEAEIIWPECGSHVLHELNRQRFDEVESDSSDLDAAAEQNPSALLVDGKD